MNKTSICITLITLATFTLLTVNISTNVLAQGTQNEQKNILTRDQVTVLLEGKSVNPKAHIHLYDTGSFHIMDGHVSVNIPCNENSEPLLDVMGGISGAKYFMKTLELQPVANMSMPGQTCMYQAEIVSEMGTNGWLYTDITIRNPSDQKITFPIDSVAIVGVNEIMKDPADAPESQGSMTLEERGGPITSNMTTMD